PGLAGDFHRTELEVDAARRVPAVEALVVADHVDDERERGVENGRETVGLARVGARGIALSVVLRRHAGRREGGALGRGLSEQEKGGGARGSEAPKFRMHGILLSVLVDELRIVPRERARRGWREREAPARAATRASR